MPKTPRVVSAEVGKFYFTVRCKNCGELFAFAEAPDPSDVSGGVVNVTKHPVPLGCDDCGHEALYFPADIQIRGVGERN